MAQPGGSVVSSPLLHPSLLPLGQAGGEAEPTHLQEVDHVGVLSVAPERQNLVEIVLQLGPPLLQLLLPGHHGVGPAGEVGQRWRLLHLHHGPEAAEHSVLEHGGAAVEGQLGVQQGEVVEPGRLD